jgi:hypothetical protein
MGQTGWICSLCKTQELLLSAVVQTCCCSLCSSSCVFSVHCGNKMSLWKFDALDSTMKLLGIYRYLCLLKLQYYHVLLFMLPIG